MKMTFVLVLMLSFAASLQAQYTGGKGGSYASAQWVKPGTQDVGVAWGPNPGVAGNGVSFQVIGARNRVTIRVWDATGKQLTIDEIVVAPTLTMGIWGREFAAGIYLLQLDVDGRLFTRKQVLMHQ